MNNHAIKTLALLVERGSAGATTNDLREAVGQLSPAPRVLELRNMGAEILTVRERKGAHPHMGRYVLISFPDHMARLLPRSSKKGGK